MTTLGEDVATCPRLLPGPDGAPGPRCGKPLPRRPDGSAAFYGPCPDCREQINAAVAEARYWKCARIAQALKDGYTIDPETHLLVEPGMAGAVDEVIASDRAGPPPRRGSGRSVNGSGSVGGSRPRGSGQNGRRSTGRRPPSSPVLRRRPVSE